MLQNYRLAFLIILIHVSAGSSPADWGLPVEVELSLCYVLYLSQASFRGVFHVPLPGTDMIPIITALEHFAIFVPETPL